MLTESDFGATKKLFLSTLLISPKTGKNHFTLLEKNVVLFHPYGKV